jgi:hypothetical protein
MISILVIYPCGIQYQLLLHIIFFNNYFFNNVIVFIQPTSAQTTVDSFKGSKPVSVVDRMIKN